MGDIPAEVVLHSLVEEAGYHIHTAVAAEVHSFAAADSHVGAPGRGRMTYRITKRCLSFQAKRGKSVKCLVLGKRDAGERAELKESLG